MYRRPDTGTESRLYSFSHLDNMDDDEEEEEYLEDEEYLDDEEYLEDEEEYFLNGQWM